MGSFWLKVEEFYWPEWTKGAQMNFEYFEIQKWLLQTIRA